MGYDFYGNGQRLSINIYWMGHLRALMGLTGMLDLEAVPPTDWEPSWEWRWLPADDPTFRRQCMIEDEMGLGPLIPRYKLSSNHHWLVSPAELTTALTALKPVPEIDRRSAMEAVRTHLEEAVPSGVGPASLSDFDSVWNDWIFFLRATAVGGFRVG